MSKITITRTGAPMPVEHDLTGIRQFLFECFRGLNEQDNKAWKRLWGRIVAMEAGEISFMEFIIPRNGKFHRKMFALLRVGFDAWEPDRKRFSYNGKAIEKNFDRFREQVLIMSGHYDQVFSLHGDKMELVAKSINYASMDDTEFEAVYSTVIDVLLSEVCTRYAGRAELDSVVEKVIGFA